MSISFKWMAVGLVACALPALAQVPMGADSVLANPKKWDGRGIVVKGLVGNYQKKTSKAGNKYTTFTVETNKKFLNVYVRDHLKPEPKNGDLVVCDGIFRVEKKVGSMTFKNEIDCSPVKDKTYGVRLQTGQTKSRPSIGRSGGG